MGPRRPALRHRRSPGSWSAATSTPPTPSSPCRRSRSAPARSPSSRCRTRSWSIRSCSWCFRGSGTVCHKHDYITAADFVRGRFGNRWLALAVTITGIVATMPYIALQLVGIQVVIGAHGRRGHRLYRRSAADHRLRHSGGLHLFERPARAGLDRHRQGHPDLHHRVRRRHRRADPARRLRQDFRRRAARRNCCWRCPAANIDRRLRRLRDAGARLGAGAVPLPALASPAS